MVINMLAYLVRRMDEYRVNFNRDRRYRKVPDRSHRAEEHHN